jgi:serine/threonine protein kinase
VLRLFDHCVGNGVDWLVTEYAEPLLSQLSEPTLDDVLECVTSLATTLAKVHALGYAHRDIKPENLFWCDRGWVVGDFGLVRPPNPLELTAEGTKLGPIYYLAPEMLGTGATLYPQAADVYSLAKVLWVLATGQKYPMQGHLHRDVVQLRLSTFLLDWRAPHLDAILHAATHPDPQQRPSMTEFRNALQFPAPPPPDGAGSVTLPAELLRELSRHSGLAERLEQAAAHQLHSQANERIVRWLEQRFNAAIGELSKAFAGAEGLTLHGRPNPVRERNVLSSPGGIAEAADRIRYEHSLFGSLKRSSGTYLDFAFGVCLDVAKTRVDYADGAVEIPVDSVPATCSAAYVKGHLHKRVTVHWCGTASFLLDGGDDIQHCSQLADGLRANLLPFVNALIDDAKSS